MSTSVEKRRTVALYSKMFKIQYRAVIKFLTKEGKRPAEIKQHLGALYGESSPSQSTVKEWVKQFRLGRESTEGDPRQEVLQDGRLKTKEISPRCGLSKTRVIRNLQDHLGTIKVNAR
jgi:hypothetical protein